MHIKVHKSKTWIWNLFSSEVPFWQVNYRQVSICLMSIFKSYAFKMVKHHRPDKSDKDPKLIDPPVY